MAALAWAALALAPAQAQTSLFTEQDWLESKYWQPAMAEGLVTLNRDDLRRFVAAGLAKARIQLSPYEIVTTSGKYFAGPHEPDATDQPAAVYVIYAGEVLLGGKGVWFEAEFEEPDILKITHWNARPGCSQGRYRLRLFRSELELIDTAYLEFGTDEPCSPK